ncbi:MAG: D-alanine--D-alanine ligase [Bacteroidetes bacterium]|nr:D-alanine--D-alanine ligase [Bacteroidota bacterium]
MSTQKIKIGIIFGGNSREREVAFAGGRTVYDNLDKNIFEAIPLFMDSFGNLCLLHWANIYKGSIRDFYPPTHKIPTSKYGFQIYADSLGEISRAQQLDLLEPLGTSILFEELSSIIDFAFLSLHGKNGEDGRIQGILEYFNIPYSGSGILPASIGMNKAVQREWMQKAHYLTPKSYTLSLTQWKHSSSIQHLLNDVKANIGLPFVIKSANQGSSIGVSILSTDDVTLFEKLVNASFFKITYRASEWRSLNYENKLSKIVTLSDFRDGMGLPMQVAIDGKEVLINHPDELFDCFEKVLQGEDDFVVLSSLDTEHEVLLEEFIVGKEFSCIVIEDKHAEPRSLPPTQIIKGTEIFDYRSKYLPGLSRKITPIPVEEKLIDAIRSACADLYSFFKFNVYARIDGFITSKNEILLNDPNTTSGMMPSSFFFHQAAEIGLNPSSFLTYIISKSLENRCNSLSNNIKTKSLLKRLTHFVAQKNNVIARKIKVAVMMGGYSSERHISIESGRNIYEKLASSEKYAPFPVFLTGCDEAHELYMIPINIMLKDNADDIAEKVKHHETNEVLLKIRNEFTEITNEFGSEIMEPVALTYADLKRLSDCVFLALHGRPGEDGEVQKHLIELGIPFNGSSIESSKITINKFTTNNLLRENGVMVSKNFLLKKEDYKGSQTAILEQAINHLGFPMIAKPADDGCSTGVKKIDDLESLKSYCEAAFRSEETLTPAFIEALSLKLNEEFPRKNHILLEALIQAQGADLFMETTTGLLTHYDVNNNVQYEIFETSESLAESGILSLEEKFLAGEGQNITPARFSKDKKLQEEISSRMRQEVEKAARILKIEGYSRIDNFVRVYFKPELRVETIIIEANSLPGMTPATCIFHQCSLNGYKPFDFIDSILEFGKARTALR